MMNSLRTLALRDEENSLPFLLDKYDTILIVEGLSDKKFYKRLFPEVGCIQIANGKASVMRRMATIRSNRRKFRVFALVDKDYSSESSYPDQQIVCTDANCMETMIWMTDDQNILLGILCEVVDEKSLDSIPVAKLYQLAYDTALKIGMLRAINAQKGWNVSFQQYRLDSTMFDEDEKLIVQKFIDHLFCNCTPQCSREELLTAFQKLNTDECSRWDIMQGHDLSASFIYHSQQHCSLFPADRWNDKEYAREDFDSKARSSANIPNLKQTNCCQTIQDWLDQFKKGSVQ